MESPKLDELEKIRKLGLRPEIVGCFVNDLKKILFVYKKEHKLWQLPQGGIENDELAEQALEREMTEELGMEFISACSRPFVFIGTDKIEFEPSRYGVKELKLTTGEEVLMKGKVYFFYAIKAGNVELDISKSEFDDLFWLDYKSAIYLMNQVTQTGKKRVSLNILNVLKSSDIIR
jgi:8-oxo-dGTP pyrophosphatase MutT (NUDIX family)